MDEFAQAYEALLRELGDGKPMVLSTASRDGCISSRTMSVVCIGETFYFQTDCAMRKAAQLAENPHAALCEGNLSIEGVCGEIGTPQENPEFLAAFRRRYPGSYERYTHLACERVYRLTPEFVQRWVYVGGEPHIERFYVGERRYECLPYDAQ